MKPGYKLTTASNGTTTITWSAGKDHDDSVYGALMRLSDVSGVKFTETFITLPFNVFDTDAGESLCDSLGVAKPQPLHVVIKPWTPKRKLFEHQVYAIDFMLKAKRGLLADAMGLAKTATSITWAMSVSLYYDNRPVVLVAKKTLQGNWIKELLVAGAIAEPNEVVVLEGINSRQQFDRTKRFYMLNPELVRDWWSELSKLKPCAAVYDEAHAYKDSKASRSVGAKMIAAAPYVLLLTGSPMPNKPQELFSLLDMLYPYAFGSKATYMLRYCGAFNNGYGLQATGVTNAEELQQRISSFYLRRTETDAGIKLPALTRNVHNVQWDDASSRLNYDALFNSCDRKALFEAIVNGRAGNATLPMLQALRKATSNAKIPATIEFCQALVKDGHSVVVFAWQKVTTTFLASKLNGVAITGDMKAVDRSKAVETFQQKGGVLVATYETLSEGVTLTRATQTVLHDLHWVPKDILQAEKRIHRIGQALPCTSTWMTLSKSVDELFAIALTKKLEAIQQIVDSSGDSSIQETVELVGVAKQRLEDEVRDALSAWVRAK